MTALWTAVCCLEAGGFMYAAAHELWTDRLVSIALFLHPPLWDFMHPDGRMAQGAYLTNHPPWSG